MASVKFQRIGIWVIVIVLTVGTLVSFVAIIFSNQNNQTSQAAISAAETQYQNQVAAQTAQLSSTYYSQFSQYASQVGTFDDASVTSLQTQDLKVGDGDTITTTSSFTAYYIGWTPDGKIFDQSIDGTSLKQPITATPGSVIQGWTDGVNGMKIGGVRVLTIPSAEAYGAQGSGTTIAPNTPLKFVIMLVPTPETIPVPAIVQQAEAAQQQ